MNESISIAVIGWLLTAIQGILGVVIAWLAYEIRSARKDIGSRVHVKECNRRMSEHGNDIREMRELLRKHEECFHRGNLF